MASEDTDTDSKMQLKLHELEPARSTAADQTTHEKLGELSTRVQRLELEMIGVKDTQSAMQQEMKEIREDISDGHRGVMKEFGRLYEFLEMRLPPPRTKRRDPVRGIKNLTASRRSR